MTSGLPPEIEHPQDAAWCQGLFASLAEGGVWGVPRSGLVFTKRGDALVLTDTMPHDPTMLLTAPELALYQADDYEAIRLHFEAAGITVRREEETA